MSSTDYGNILKKFISFSLLFKGEKAASHQRLIKKKDKIKTLLSSNTLNSLRVGKRVLVKGGL